MGMLGHIVRLFSAVIIGLLFSYVVYRALAPLDSFLASIFSLGFMMSTPFMLILVFYNRLRWGVFFFVAVWLLYASAVWLYMLAGFFTKVFHGQAWIPVFILTIGGIAFSLVVLRRRGIGLPQAFQGKRGGLKGVEEVQEVVEEPVEGIVELEPQEEEPDFSRTMELLDEAHCRILATLLESGSPYSKKELAKAVGATYKRVLKAVEELEKLGLVEVKEAPRSARGSSIVHAVKLSPAVSRKSELAKKMVKRRMEELEAVKGRAKTST
ncbi:MAG: winged helix-turn-helix transcriptional regulator [Candidatus Brockarchaeota archaeon]|nr:winged helix-turn-helix transcriptional regulator [Candidatus Brockarchaeota archaeon]MBO3809565.1 winged helix-turn-helix transcriptional regulator [Candidatus Brockarchaeota archaeon]